MNIALLIITLFLIISIVMGLLAKRGKDMSMEQWAIGGRGFGGVFVFLLLAGETYSVFTLLGTSGLAFNNGAAAFYLLAFTALGTITSYWLLPVIWKYAKENNVVSQSQFFSKKYNSTGLGVFVAIVGVVALIPYITILFKSMGILVAATSYGAISSNVAIWVGMIALLGYVMVSGIHGSAWTSTIKDFLIFFVILFLGIYLPLHYHGSFQGLFQAVSEVKPQALTLPEKGLSVSWFISTVAISSFAYFMWPHVAPTVFASKNAKAFRLNAVLLPIYAIMVLFVYFVGFTAIVQLPGLENGDFALLELSMKSFDPWFVGIIGATGLLATLVPGSMMLMSAATMITTNVIEPLKPGVSDKSKALSAKGFVILLSIVCAFFSMSESSTLATLYLTSFSLITQMAPSLYLSLRKNNGITKYGAGFGMLVGVAIVIYITFTKTTMAMLFPSLPSVIQDLNIGIIALAANILVMFIISSLTKNTSINDRTNGNKSDIKLTS
ncbi:sodium:solute symporter family protein [Peribacillus huizhouensis]|uniref:SSS family solute:Na+ symporter n=1 Tax=Peribacillus huizhouensis TaxID=1501239 RepID=A0ABR6CWH1_9BACI|nr:sodium:solute symporter family protein [Peribacillus huizhouensis]MBA9028965.1 SSS family solute:Na+ symporter [Peribacillus huizhouensis]